MLDGAKHFSGAEVELLGVRALFAAMAGRFDEAAAAARQALDGSRLSTQAETYAGWALAMVEGMTGRAGQVPAVIARTIAAARRLPETAPLQLNIAWWEVFGLGLAGQLGLVGKAVDRLASTLNGTATTIFQTTFEGWHALLTGRVRTATRLLLGFRPYLPGHGGGWTAILEVILAQTQAMAGDALEAREALDRAEAFRHPGVTVIEPQLVLARAWLAAAEGSASTAVRRARQAATLAARSGQFAIEVLARHAAVSFGDRAQAFRLTELAHQVDGPRAPATAAHAVALANQDPVALLAASAQLAAAELMLPAAEAAAQLSNREIAQHLGISVRTVEGHIYHACVKLGLPDRTALSALAPNRKP